jgi:hypothetical protein
MMNLKKLLVTLLAAIFSLSILAPVTNVDAQEGDENESRIFFGIVIEPALQEISVAPGQTFSDKIKLTNDFESGSEFTFFPEPVNFRQAGESGVAELYVNEELPDSADAAEWFTFQEESYSLDFGESVESNFTMTVPADAEPGGYYVALTYKKEQNEQVDNVAIGEAIGALLFITVEGDLNRTGELLEFKTDKRFYDFTPVEFQIRYKNDGNIHDIVGGNIFVHTGDVTDPIETMEVNPDGRIVLPGSIRQYSEIYNSGFIRWNDGRLSIQWSEFPTLRFGRYQATLKLKHFENGDRITTERQVSFWIIPWEIILIVILLVLLIAYVVRRRMSKDKRQSQK